MMKRKVHFVKNNAFAAAILIAIIGISIIGMETVWVGRE